MDAANFVSRRLLEVQQLSQVNSIRHRSEVESNVIVADRVTSRFSWKLNRFVPSVTSAFGVTFFFFLSSRSTGEVPAGAHQSKRQSWKPRWWCGVHREEQEQNCSELRSALLKEVLWTTGVRSVWNVMGDAFRSRLPVLRTERGLCWSNVTARHSHQDLRRRTGLPFCLPWSRFVQTVSVFLEPQKWAENANVESMRGTRSSWSRRRRKTLINPTSEQQRRPMPEWPEGSYLKAHTGGRALRIRAARTLFFGCSLWLLLAACLDVFVMLQNESGGCRQVRTHLRFSSREDY